MITAEQLRSLIPQKFDFTAPLIQLESKAREAATLGLWEVCYSLPAGQFPEYACWEFSKAVEKNFPDCAVWFYTIPLYHVKLSWRKNP